MISNPQIKYIIVIVVIAAAFIIWFGIIRFAFGVNNPFYVVSTDGEHKVIVHRVAQILNADSTNGERLIRTKGDANPYSIPYLDYPIKGEDYIGKVVYVIPKVGLITRAIAPPLNYIIIGVIAVILIYYIKKQK